jgi:hypothetical protein
VSYRDLVWRCYSHEAATAVDRGRARPAGLLRGSLAARNAMPTIGPEGTFPRSGGLMSYGSSLADAFRDLGIYASKILKGSKPADLPVMQLRLCRLREMGEVAHGQSEAAA